MKIDRSYVPVSGYGTVLKDPKTKSSRRTIALPQILIEYLAEYKQYQDEEKRKHGDKWLGINEIFTGSTGSRLHPNSVDKWIEDVLKEFGIAKVTLHSLRHTNITMQIMAGVPITIVAGRAGHARVSTTTDIYSHFMKSVDMEAAETINKIFS